MTSPYCELTPGCESPKEGSTLGCSGCNRDARKAAKLALMEPKKRKPIKKVAEKRAKQLTQYSRLKAQYIAIHQICENIGCNQQATTIHHMAGRENEMLLDVNYFKALCIDCHRKVEVEPNWAKDNNLSTTRTDKADEIRGSKL